MILFAHLIACFWFFLTIPSATGVDMTTNPAIDFNSNPMYAPYGIRTWASVYGVSMSDITTQYIAALYWTYTALFTVGYGDIHPVNTGERTYTILVIFSAVVVFSMMIARMRMVVDSQNVLAKDLHIKMDDFKSFLEEKEMPLHMRGKSKDAYAYYLQKVPSLEEKGFYNQLPKIIRHRFVSNKFSQEIHHIHLFRNSEIEFLSQVLKPQHATLIRSLTYPRTLSHLHSLTLPPLPPGDYFCQAAANDSWRHHIRLRRYCPQLLLTLSPLTLLVGS